jgi:ribokinase/sulfofructose kinase
MATTGSHEQTLDILAVGGAALDTVITLDHLPAHDEKVLGKLAGYLPGGPAGNFACAASRLGLRVAMLAEVGSDEPGRLIVEDFQRHGVDTSLIQVIEGAASNFTIGLIDPTGEKAMVVVPMLADDYPLDLVASVLPRTRLVFGMPHDRVRFAALIDSAHRSGVEVMIDVEKTILEDVTDIGAFLAGVDIVSFNVESFAAATGESPSIEGARKLLDLGPHTVVITRGARGALAASRGAVAETPGYRVEVTDTTGASDTFNAAFARAMLGGMPLCNGLRFANAAAAISVTGLGPRGHLPRVEEVDAFMRARSNQA